MQKFSVCMAVYGGDQAEDFKKAVFSIYEQTVRPDEIIIVVDGPVPDPVAKVIADLESAIDIIRVVWSAENQGHAVARETGLLAAKHELVAIMDSDDLSLPDRFEKQLKVFERHPEVSVVGGLISEFVSSTGAIAGVREVPQYNYAIKKYLKSRCPMNFVTVMMRRSHVLKVGGFIGGDVKDWYCEEDYYLWIRLARAGFQFYNIQENLVNVRVGDEMYRRRGGWRYFSSEASLQFFMLRFRLIGFPRFLWNVGIRFVVQVLIPDSLRSWVFKTFARR